MTRATKNVDKVIGPAVEVGNLVIMREKPFRHGDVISSMNSHGLHSSNYIEGFMTTEGFMDRREAAEFVGTGGELSTIDLW